MEDYHRFIRIYLIFALIWGSLGVIDSILNLINLNSKYYIIPLSLLGLLFFGFNLFSVYRLRQEDNEPLIWVLPLYYIISYVLFFILGLVLIWANWYTSILVMVITIISLLFSSGEIIFSLYLLKRFKFI